MTNSFFVATSSEPAAIAVAVAAIAQHPIARFNPSPPTVQMQASSQLFQDLLSTFGIKDNQRYQVSHPTPPATRHTAAQPLEMPSLDNRPSRNGVMLPTGGANIASHVANGRSQLHHAQSIGSSRVINSMQDLWTSTTLPVSNASPPPSAPGSMSRSNASRGSGATRKRCRSGELSAPACCLCLADLSASRARVGQQET